MGRSTGTKWELWGLRRVQQPVYSAGRRVRPTQMVHDRVYPTPETCVCVLGQGLGDGYRFESKPREKAAAVCEETALRGLE